jgi:hypothetical protein
MFGSLKKVRAKQYHNQITGQQGNSLPEEARFSIRFFRFAMHSPVRFDKNVQVILHLVQ